MKKMHGFGILFGLKEVQKAVSHMDVNQDAMGKSRSGPITVLA